MKRALVIATLLFAGSARGDVWQHAIDPEPQIDVYDALMTKGDDSAIRANSQSISIQQMRKDIDTSIESYRAAATVKPKSAEPFFRIGSVLNSFFFDCDRTGYSTPPRTCQNHVVRDDRARETVEAWDKFESLAPLDPRVNEVLLQRAILRTKLVSTSKQPKVLLEGAAKDYQALLDREDGVLVHLMSRETVLGNLAETHMMLGNLDAAIEIYLQASRGARSSTLFGLAVALDRDDRQMDAMLLIRSIGEAEYEKFQQLFEAGLVFFVPAGEEEYYFALCEEAFGRETALNHWRAFLASGAHPIFQARAREHVDRLLARKSLRWKVPLVPNFEDGSLRLPKK